MGFTVHGILQARILEWVVRKERLSIPLELGGPVKFGKSFQYLGALICLFSIFFSLFILLRECYLP